jgi:hypothetical protein
MVAEKKKKFDVNKLLLSSIPLFIVWAFFVLIMFCPRTASAATLSISPRSGDYKVGSTFKLSIYAASADQALNTVAGSLTFPPSLLEVTSLSKEGSVFGLWIREPSFSNTAGNVSFESGFTW